MIEYHLVQHRGIQQDQVSFRQPVRHAADLIHAAAFGDIVALQQAMPVPVHGIVFPVTVDIGHIRIQRQIGQRFNVHRQTSLAPIIAQDVKNNNYLMRNKLL